MIAFDKLIEVHAQTLKGHAQVIAEIKVVCHSDIVIAILRILRIDKFVIKGKP